MTYLFAVGITVGILAGAWVYAGGTLGFVGFAGFLGWATYFAAGGGKKGIISTLCSNLSGVFLGSDYHMGCHNLYGCTILVFYNSFCCNYVLAGKAEFA